MSELAVAVQRKLAGLRLMLRLMFVAHGMARVVMALALLLVWHFLTDTFLEAPRGVRVAMLIVMAAATLSLFLRAVIYPLTRRISERELALMVENEYPLLAERLITALEMSRDPGRYRDVASQAMIDRTVREGFEVAGRLRFREVVQSGRLLLVTGLCMGAMVALCALLLVNRETSEIWAKRLLLSSAAYPRKTHLEVKFPYGAELARFPTNDVIDLNLTYDEAARTVSVARNAGVRVVALPHGEIPEKAFIVIRSRQEGARSEPMRVEYRDVAGKREVAYYHYNIPVVLFDEQTVTIEAGDAEEGPFAVKVVPAPALKDNTEVVYAFPPYMRRERQAQIGPRTLKAPEGTRATMTFETTRPLVSDGARIHVRIAGADTQSLTAQALNDERTRFEAALSLDPSMLNYEIQLFGADGLRNTEKYEYNIRVEEDLPPKVDLIFYGNGLEDQARVPATFSGKLPLRYAIKDQFGVKHRRLRYRFNLGVDDETIAKAGFSLSNRWREFAPFGDVYAQRDAATESLLDTLKLLEGKVGVALEQLRSDRRPPLDELMREMRGLGGAVQHRLNLMYAARKSGLEPHGEALKRAWEVLIGGWQSVDEDILRDEAFARSLTAPNDNGATRKLEAARAMLARAGEAARAFSTLTATDAGEEFLFTLESLLRPLGITSEERLIEAIRHGGGRTLALELQIEAEDFNYRQDESGEGGRGGVGASNTIAIEVMTIDDLLQLVSRYIRSVLKDDLERVTRQQHAVYESIEDFIRKRYDVAFADTPEGREARDIIQKAQHTQGALPDDTLRLAERFGHVAQAYIFNDLEWNDPAKAQENRIQAARVLLSLLTADVSKGDVMASALAAVRSGESDALKHSSVDSLLRELDLLSGMIGVRESFERGSFADMVARSDYRHPATLRRLDLLFKNILNRDSAPEARRKDLDAVREAQRQSLAALAMIAERLDKWEKFDALREALRHLRDDIEKRRREIEDMAKE